jgi:hypothetical protein
VIPWIPIIGTAFVAWIAKEISGAYERGREAGEKARPRPPVPRKQTPKPKPPRREEIEENPYSDPAKGENDE